MAATYTLTNVRSRDVAGIRRRIVGDFTGDASYLVASGTTVNPADIGLGYIEFFDLNLVSDGSHVYFVQAVHNAAGTVTLTFYSATGTQVGNGDLSTFSGRFEALGK